MVAGRLQLEPPRQAFVLAWVRQAYRWQALVVYVEQASTEQERVIQRWVPRESVAPVRSDPNTVFSYSWFGELGRPPTRQ